MPTAARKVCANNLSRLFKLVCVLSNGAISNYLERTMTLFLRSHHSLTLNISQMATDTTIVYYRRRIGNRTQAFEWHQFQWPLSHISKSRYYSTSNNSQMVQDRAIVIQWRTNRKSYMVYRTVPFSMTLKLDYAYSCQESVCKQLK